MLKKFKKERAHYTLKDDFKGKFESFEKGWDTKMKDI